MRSTTTGIEDFWAGTYQGRRIAVLNHSDGWLVYLDHALQHNMLFATAEAAIAWLQRKIDGSKGVAA
jgi:hypothetical protein